MPIIIMNKVGMRLAIGELVEIDGMNYNVVLIKKKTTITLVNCIATVTGKNDHHV